jgi:hypothetical protein
MIPMTIPPLSALIIAGGMLGSAALVTTQLSPADAQAKLIPTGGGDVLLTMPVLQDKAWFIHAHMGRVRACTADGASVTGDRPGPRCSNWTE